MEQSETDKLRLLVGDKVLNCHKSILYTLEYFKERITPTLDTFVLDATHTSAIQLYKYLKKPQQKNPCGNIEELLSLYTLCKQVRCTDLSRYIEEWCLNYTAEAIEKLPYVLSICCNLKLPRKHNIVRMLFSVSHREMLVKAISTLDKPHMDLVIVYAKWWDRLYAVRLSLALGVLDELELKYAIWEGVRIDTLLSTLYDPTTIKLVANIYSTILFTRKLIPFSQRIVSYNAIPLDYVTTASGAIYCEGKALIIHVPDGVVFPTKNSSTYMYKPDPQLLLVLQQLCSVLGNKIVVGMDQDHLALDCTDMYSSSSMRKLRALEGDVIEVRDILLRPILDKAKILFFAVQLYEFHTEL